MVSDDLFSSIEYRARERQRKSDRPAKLNEKKGDRDLEREIKTKETFFCWKNNINMKIL